MKSKTLKEINKLVNPPHLKEFRRFQNSIPSFTPQQVAVENSIVNPSMPSAANEALQSFASQQSAVKSAIAVLTMPSAANEALQSFASQQSAVENAIAALTMPSAANVALQSFASQQTAVESAIAALTMPSAANVALQSFASQQTAVESAIAALTMPSAANEALQSFASQQSAVERATAALKMPSVIDEVLQSVSAHQFELEATVRKFAEVSTATAMLVEPDFLLKITSLISNTDFGAIDISNVGNDLEISEEKLNSVKDSSSFLRVYSTLPPCIRLILGIVLLFFLIPQIQEKAASLSPSITEGHKKVELNKRI